MTIQDFKGQLEAILTELLPADVEVDELGSTIPATQYRAERLGLLSQEIRRCAWTPEAISEALAIAGEADEKAADLLGNARPQPLPRFESFVSGGTIVPAIQ